jgi:hypothetical protein
MARITKRLVDALRPTKNKAADDHELTDPDADAEAQGPQSKKDVVVEGLRSGTPPQ